MEKFSVKRIIMCLSVIFSFVFVSVLQVQADVAPLPGERVQSSWPIILAVAVVAVSAVLLVMYFRKKKQ